MLNVKRGFLWWKTLQLLSDIPGLCSATNVFTHRSGFPPASRSFSFTLTTLRPLASFSATGSCFQWKKAPPNTFMVLRQLLSNHLVNKCLFHTGQKTHSHVLTPGFRRCCEWVQSPALIGCDGNTTPVWSCKCLPFVKCDSTVHIEVQAAGLSRLFFIHLGATLGHQLDSAEFERDTEVKDKEIRYHCDTVSDFCVTTRLDSCLMGTEHVRLSTEMRKKCDVSLLSLFHHPLWNKWSD